MVESRPIGNILLVDVNDVGDGWGFEKALFAKSILLVLR